DERASQSAYLVVDHLTHNDPLVLGFEQQARARLGEALDVCELAAAIGTSRRTLERRTQAALGMSPLALVQRLRTERAVHLLRTTAQSVEQIAPQVGYANASTLRSQLRRIPTGPQVIPARPSRQAGAGLRAAPARTSAGRSGATVSDRVNGQLRTSVRPGSRISRPVK